MYQGNERGTDVKRSYGTLKKRRKRSRRQPPWMWAALVLALVLLLVCVNAVVTSIRGETEPASAPPPSISDPLPASSGQNAVPAAAGAALPPVSSQALSSAPPETAQLSDPLLVLVNEEMALPKDWQVDLRTIGETEQVDVQAYSSLNDLIRAASEDDVWLWVASGYRSVEEQKIIFDRAVNENLELGMDREEAEQEASRTIQLPGHSEHHTGLAVDFNDVDDGFEETSEYQWLYAHAAEYGFVQRYRSDKTDVTGIDHESWHYRYVGKEHAQEMERLDMCLEEYVDYMKKQES